MNTAFSSKCTNVVFTGPLIGRRVSSPPACPPLWFVCDDGECIEESKVCDFTPHCSSGEDEASCRKDLISEFTRENKPNCTGMLDWATGSMNSCSFTLNHFITLVKYDLYFFNYLIPHSHFKLHICGEWVCFCFCMIHFLLNEKKKHKNYKYFSSNHIYSTKCL